MNFGTQSRSIDDVLESVIAPEEKDVVNANGGARVVILGKKSITRPQSIVKSLT